MIVSVSKTDQEIRKQAATIAYNFGVSSKATAFLVEQILRLERRIAALEAGKGGN
jgi:hypothetical protein